MSVMVVELKLRKIGNSVGVVLPKEVLNQLKVGEGDTVCRDRDALTAASAWGRRTTRSRSKMEAAESVISRYRNTLRELAK